jgi:hypothetical protein
MDDVKSQLLSRLNAENPEARRLKPDARRLKPEAILNQLIKYNLNIWFYF